MQYDNNIQSSQKSQVDEDNIFIAAHPRIIYLRRLYLMIYIQLLITASAVYVKDSHYHKFGGVYADKINQVTQLPVVFTVCSIVSMSCLLFSFCARQKVQENHAANWALYTLFTLSTAFCVTYMVNFQKNNFVFLSIISLTLQGLSLFIYVLMSKTELTFQGASIFIFSSLFISLQIFTIFTDTDYNHIMAVGVLQVLWGYYLVYDTQSSVSTPYQFEPQLTFSDDPLSGAVCIYMDVFVLLLRMTDLLRETIIKYR